MSNAAIEARLDKLLERVSGGAHQPPVVDPNREVARMVKRTEVATMSQKQNVVKFIVIGVVIILLLVGMIYFVAKTKYGKGIRDVIGEYLPFGSKKRKAQDDAATQAPKKVLVAEDVDLRSRPSIPPQRPSTRQVGRHPPVGPPVTVRVPNIQPKDENEHLDPGAVPFRRRRVAQAPPNIPSNVEPPPRGPQVTENDDEPPPPPSQRPRGPSPPIEDKGDAPPPELVDASNYQND